MTIGEARVVNDREKKVAGIVAGAGLLGLLVMNAVYDAGVRAGLAQSGNPAAVAHHGDGFFPFPLLLIGGVVLFIAWRKRWFNGNGPRSIGGGPGGGPPHFFEEWHRRAHEADAGTGTGTPTERGPVAAAPEATRADQGQTDQPDGPTQPQRNPNETTMI